MKRLIQVCLAIQFVLIGVALATGCIGCGPGSTDPVGTEANVASNNGNDEQANGVKVIDGVPYINGDMNCRVAYDRDGDPVCATWMNAVGTDSGDPFKGNIVNGVVCEGSEHEVLYDANGYPAVCADATTVCDGRALFNKSGQQVCQYEPPTIDNPVEHEAACELLTPGDGQWFREDSKEPMMVGCQPTDDSACAVTSNGEGSLFDGIALVGTSFPLSKPHGIDTFEMDITSDGRLVQRWYVNLSGQNELDSEAFFRR